MVIVVPTLAVCKDATENVVRRMVARLEIAFSKNMANGVDRPSHVVRNENLSLIHI